MPRPRDPSRKKERLYSARFAHGHCEPINGVTYIRLPDGRRRSTGLRWGRATADDARALLESALAAFYANGRDSRRVAVAPAAATSVAPATVGYVADFVADYLRLVLRDAIPKAVAEHQCARRHYLAATLPMDADAIEHHLLERNATSTLTVGTRKGYLMRLRQMFEWAVRRGVLPRNPVDVVPVPSQRRRKIPGFDAAETAAIIAYFAEGPARDAKRKATTAAERTPNVRRRVDGKRTPPVRVRPTHWRDYELIARLQSLTAMRCHEVMNLRRSDVGADVLRIDGKGGNVRYFPLVAPPELGADASDVARARVAWIRDVRAIIDELMARPARRGAASGDDWLFAVRDKSRYRDHLHDAKAAKKIPNDERVSHALRKYALWHWREVRLLDADVRAELAGHGEDVADAFYNKSRTPSEAMRAIVLSRL